MEWTLFGNDALIFESVIDSDPIDCNGRLHFLTPTYSNCVISVGVNEFSGLRFGAPTYWYLNDDHTNLFPSIGAVWA